MIEVINLSKRFGKIIALDSINVKFNSGEITAIVGPNSSGKTTLIKCILGLINFTSGRILFKGCDISKDIYYKGLIGYMPQIARYPENLRVKELLDFILNLSNRVKSNDFSELLEVFNLAPHINKFVKNLSGGTLQKLSAVLAFMFYSELYILDEPTAGLDPIAIMELKNLIMKRRAQGATFIVVSHQLAEIETFADRIVFLLDGKVVIDDSIVSIVMKNGKRNLEESIIEHFRQNNIKIGDGCNF